MSKHQVIEDSDFSDNNVISTKYLTMYIQDALSHILALSEM